MTLAINVFGSLLLLGTLGYMALEQLPLIDALYLTVTTVSTGMLPAWTKLREGEH